MKKKVKKNKLNSKKIQKGSIGNFFVFGVLVLLIFLGMSIIGGLPSTNTPQEGSQIQITTPIPNSSHQTLQLETFGFKTITPTISYTPQPSVYATPPSNSQYCPIADEDNGTIVNSTCTCLDYTIVCKNGLAYTDSGQPFTLPPDLDFNFPNEPPTDNPCGSYLAPTDGRYCIGKPVIYLYPTMPTAVTVRINTTGNIVVSDPTYPQGGWKQILADPDGTLYYQGNKYTELFYETSVTDFQKPDTGITIATDQLSVQLNSLLTQLGLIGHEKQEFISYWLPRLTALRAPYIYFSVIDKTAKTAVDNVSITPKPDTQIAFIAYFKPLEKPLANSLQLPKTPQRKGFVSVEWGGVIDN